MGSTGKLETHAGGREIHVVPFLQVDPNCSGIFFEGPDPIPRQINPRRFLTAGDLNRIRRSFPTSSGIVVLMAGQAIILYRTQSDVNAAWRFPPILSIGGLGLQHSLDTREPSVAEVDSGSVVFNPDPSANQACAIGIKIKTPGGAQAITTVTHGFVRPNRALRNLKLTVYSWYSRFKNALSKFTSMRYPAMPAFITTKRSPLTNSPMGKEVFLLETNEQVCLSAVTSNLARSILTPC